MKGRFGASADPSRRDANVAEMERPIAIKESDLCVAFSLPLGTLAALSTDGKIGSSILLLSFSPGRVVRRALTFRPLAVERRKP